MHTTLLLIKANGTSQPTRTLQRHPTQSASDRQYKFTCGLTWFTEQPEDQAQPSQPTVQPPAQLCYQTTGDSTTSTSPSYHLVVHRQTTIFPNIIDSTSSQETGFTPSTTGVYTLIFSFPGQIYGANGDGYEKSTILGDYYTPSSAQTTVTVQANPISSSNHQRTITVSLLDTTNIR